MKIAITSRITNAPNYEEPRDSISHDWEKILEKIDSKMIIIPNNLKNLGEFLDEVGVEGIILSGGDNIGDHPNRDQTEEKLVQYGIKNKIPIFGVCRGMQVLNKFFEGDVKSTNSLKHVGKPHEIIISKKFNELIKTKNVEVNSFHKNLISKKDLGNNLKSFATYQEDDTIEGFYHEDLPIIGVMWHPERNSNDFNELILKKIFQDKKFW